MYLRIWSVATEREELLTWSHMLIHKSMCINLWESTLEMEGITPCFGEVLNWGWDRRKWLARGDCFASVSCGASAVLGEMVQESKLGLSTKNLNRTWRRTVFLITFHLRHMFIVSRQILRFCPYLNWNKRTVFFQFCIWLASKVDLDGCPTWIVKDLEEIF